MINVTGSCYIYKDKLSVVVYNTGRGKKLLNYPFITLQKNQT